MDNYLETTAQIYRDAALNPDVVLCCTSMPMDAFPGLEIPVIMKEMLNYR